MVLSYAAWQNKFGGNPDIVGRTLAIRGYPLQVIGIAKPEFGGLGETPRDFWVPMTMAGQLEDGPSLFGPEHPNRLIVVGRLREELNSAQAEAALAVWARQTTMNQRQEERAKGALLQSQATRVRLTPQVVAAFAPILAAFVLVLLIACANIANMMLSRAVARQREIGIRLSLGAARFRLIRLLLTESILLAFPSALAGFAISEAAIHFGQKILFAAMPADFAQFVTIVPLPSDPRVFGSCSLPLWVQRCCSGSCQRFRLLGWMCPKPQRVSSRPVFGRHDFATRSWWGRLPYVPCCSSAPVCHSAVAIV